MVVGTCRLGIILRVAVWRMCGACLVMADVIVAGVVMTGVVMTGVIMAGVFAAGVAVTGEVCAAGGLADVIVGVPVVRSRIVRLWAGPGAGRREAVGLVAQGGEAAFHLPGQDLGPGAFGEGEAEALGGEVQPGGMDARQTGDGLLHLGGAGGAVHALDPPGQALLACIGSGHRTIFRSFDRKGGTSSGWRFKRRSGEFWCGRLAWRNGGRRRRTGCWPSASCRAGPG